jgi:CCR4-NOT transcriptional complex subunit CAF120
MIVIPPSGSMANRHPSAVSSLMSTFSQKLQHPGTSSSPFPQHHDHKTPTASVADAIPSNENSPSPRRDAVLSSSSLNFRPGRSASQPASIIYQPHMTESVQDTPPELLPIFAFLNSHSNKLYQEGYFLKLNDLDISKLSRLIRACPRG